MFSPTLGKTLLKHYNLKTLRSIISFFFITCIFLWKKFWICINCIFYECWGKKINNILQKKKKVLISLKGPPLRPLNTLWLFSPNFFFLFYIHKKCISYQFEIFSQKYTCIKKERNGWQQGYQIAAFQQSFSRCWWKRSILAGSLIKQTT